MTDFTPGKRWSNCWKLGLLVLAVIVGTLFHATTALAANLTAQHKPVIELGFPLLKHRLAVRHVMMPSATDLTKIRDVAFVTLVSSRSKDQAHAVLTPVPGTNYYTFTLNGYLVTVDRSNPKKLKLDLLKPAPKPMKVMDRLFTEASGYWAIHEDQHGRYMLENIQSSSFLWVTGEGLHLTTFPGLPGTALVMKGLKPTPYERVLWTSLGKLTFDSNKQCVTGMFGQAYIANVRWYWPNDVAWDPHDKTFKLRPWAKAYADKHVPVGGQSCVHTGRRMVAQISVVAGQAAADFIKAATSGLASIAVEGAAGVVCGVSLGTACAVMGAATASIPGIVKIAASNLPDAKGTFYFGSPRNLGLYGSVYNPYVKER